MSQEKVNKYKEEKKNRKKTLKKQKVRKVLLVFIASLGVGAIIGIPLGRGIYNYQKKQELKHQTVKASEYSSWFDEKWADEYAPVSSTDDELQKLLDSFNNGTWTDATETDSE